MAFDASVMKCFVEETKNKILNSKIDKIHQPQKDELIISLRSISGNNKLFISANPSYPRIHLTDDKSDNPMSPPMFCMLLRKHIGGGKVIGINQHGFERILIIDIVSYDELGDLTTKKLVVEIMGKHSNIILLNNDNKIIDSIKRIDISTSSVRQILPCLTYKLPPSQEKLNPLETDFSNLDFKDTREPEKYLMEKFYGLSKLTAREIVFLAQNSSLFQALETTFRDIKRGVFNPCIIYSPDGTPFDYNATPITQYDESYKVEYNPSISYIIQKFYSEKALHFRISQSSAQLLKLVNNNIDRLNKKIGIFNQQLADASKRHKYKEYGDLITANLYRIKENSEFIEVENFYEDNMPIIKIKLDSTISPAKNAQKYFIKYNKAKNAEAQAYIQIASAQKELNYMESVLDEIQRAEKASDLTEIKDELCKEGYIKREISKYRRKESAPELSKIDIDGYTVYVGKNNHQNDYLTLKIARSADIWLHTKNIPGSHVIITKKNAEEDIPDSVIIKAAKLAAYHSKAKSSAKVPVDYTQVKNVKKPNGAKPGMVIYDHYNTVYVTP